MSFELAACLTVFGLAGNGALIGYSVILVSLAYLGSAGVGSAFAGEKSLRGLYKSLVLLAVELAEHARRGTCASPILFLPG